MPFVFHSGDDGSKVQGEEDGGDVASFTFEELCEANVAAADYIAICDKFHTIGIQGVPLFVNDNKFAAYRREIG